MKHGSLDKQMTGPEEQLVMNGYECLLKPDTLCKLKNIDIKHRVVNKNIQNSHFKNAPSLTAFIFIYIIQECIYV